VTPTEVLVEETDLDAGIPMVFRDFGKRVRIAFDPREIDEATALTLLTAFVPRLAGAMNVVHRADA